MKKVINLIIVDESGSMSVIHQQAFAGMNETLSTIRKMQEQHPDLEQRVSLLTFDSTHKSYKYDNVAAKDTRDLSPKDYNPCGATPLYDAMGLSISKLNAMVESDDKVLVTVITDGEENCSTEWTLKMIRTLIEKLKKENWTFTLIGTDNLDVEGMARSMAIDEHLEFQEDAEGTRMMFERESRARSRYMCRVAACEEAPTGSFFSES